MSDSTSNVPVLVARGLCKAYGPLSVLTEASLSLAVGDRVGLLGVNGSGKTTLARILCGAEEPDDGSLSRRRGSNVTFLEQTPRLDPELTALQTVIGGLGRWSEARKRYEQVSAALEKGEGDLTRLLEEQAEAAADVERLGGWELSHRAEAVLGQLKVSKLDTPVGHLSGGERRRVALARVLLAAPDLAILDEPTNHLDVQTVEWLERFLLESFAGAVLLVTHDRWFLDRVVRRTLELDRGKLYAYDGGYEAFLQAKAERLDLETRTEANRQKFVRQELEWVKRAPKARTGKQKARIKRAESAMAQTVRRLPGQVKLGVASQRLGKSILDLQGLSVSLGGKPLVNGLDFSLTRGQRVGVIGPNGCGKTTLLRTLKGELQPSDGRVIVGKNTRLTYLDQQRGELDLDGSVLDNVSDGKPAVKVGEQWVDIHPYLARFLFVGQVLDQPVGSLSGGERTRVALARLMLQPSNLLLLDEPTNDLDLATLSALEQMLLEFAGTALVVTHDRWFLDRVATAVLAFEGDGEVVHYAGNYTTYRALRAQAETEARQQRTVKPAKPPRQRPKKKRGLTYAERLELEAVEPRVEQADARVTELEAKLADPTLYQRRGAEVPGLNKELARARKELEQLMNRWEELEAKKHG